MNENDRLKMIRTEKGLTLAKFGERIGLTPGAVSDMERGRRGITEQTRNSVCREFSINKEWLMTGTGEMEVPEGDELEALARRYNLSRDFQAFIEKLVTADSSVQEAVIDLILQTSAAINGEAPPIETEPKKFEEMTPAEIAAKVEDERRVEKEAADGSGRSSSTA